MMEVTDMLPQELASQAELRLQSVLEKWPDVKTSQVGEQVALTLFGLSDFIFQTCQRYQNVAEYFLTLNNQSELLAEIAFIDQASLQLDEVSFLQKLRSFRHFVMAVYAARDFLKLQTIESTMTNLSNLADQFYLLVREWVKLQMSARSGLALDPQGNEISLIALGMGKLGGGELNFSSDIDLIFGYAEKGETSTGRRSEDFQIYFTKMAQKIIQLLDSVTADGRVFRVDMRLRPFGDSGPLVSSFDALEDYYQDQGREWERYALLKARPLGLSSAITETEQTQQQLLLQVLKPFVYRRYIDYSVIDALRKMKLQIQQEVKRRNLKLNIKLGEGGIREAEFIVQALQMLRGGKDAQLQKQSLLKTLPELVALSVFTVEESEQLKTSYLWLRQCEQYLQAFADEQTQTLPQDELKQLTLITLFQLDSWSAFLDAFKLHSQKINHIFINVIGETPQDSDQQEDHLISKWRDIWLHSDEKSDDEPDILLVKQLRKDLANSVSGSRGQDKLDLLMPLLFAECESQNIELQQATAVFNLVKKIASRTTYLELLDENQGARTQLVKLVTSCHFIGTELTKFPLLLDLLIDPKLLYSPAELSSYYSDLRRNLLRVEPDDLELQMEVLRQFKLSTQLAIAACDVQGVMNLMQVSDHLTELASVCLHFSVEIAWGQMVAKYGYPVGSTFENKNFGVIGYGKLGGYELGYGSDLDIVFVHNCDSSQPTDGKKPIDSRQFYLKLSQRVMHIFTTRTLSGELYEIDTRLRPSGASGLLAINIETFAEYQQTEAWTWEHQALVRSRFILGDEHLGQRFNQIRHNILTKQRDADLLKQEIASMRIKMFDNLNKEKEGFFDLKQSRGGIADIEFISQLLVLSKSNQYPELAELPDNIRILQQASKLNLISESDNKELVDAYILYRRLYHTASLNGDEKLSELKEITESRDQVLAIWQTLF
ncbi:glutamate-ammonia-ligase adenylyltransferase [Psychrosphaera saromensis]|nr:bifunctional [glutamate--ammonia ligase]-adenylyl-L-tyrosine phosphorylase/[glutamate--ammonia-ligase] adenylyltransferase [Psychrosphaera saromensis]GHB55858.1 glutamate-ammonia-ligase adenylyltransferase [Psychrosphaera saromensis]GLQ13796.1 glutamate-ammonia-ligase adenylyltransferase [Psychrosphaera saromensis]